MAVYFPPALFVIAIVSALLGVDPPGGGANPGLDERLLLWTIYLSFGWSGIGAGLSHTVFARSTARGIGWETNGFQYEIGFADFATGLGALYAVHSGSAGALVAISIAAGVFRILAGINHIRGIVKDHNLAPGNSLILLVNFGPAIIVAATLFSTGVI